MPEGLREFLAMGGYWPYVWPSFAIALGIMLWLLLASLGEARRSQRLLAELRALRSEPGEGGDAT
ncbi:MAG: heme exporter protein CcmD [Alphaproteobacteria bacterium]|nr:heme exporter protein CcmD [Alphaproteobacteria bacterium]